MRAELGRSSEPNWLTAKADPADRRAPGEDDCASRTGSDTSAPWRKLSFKDMPSNTQGQLSPVGSGGGAGVGNAEIGPSNTTWAQGGAPAFPPLGGYANPTPTESLVNQAPKEARKVQVDLITADSNADRGSSDIHQKIVDRASAQIGSGDWHFKRGEGKFWYRYRQMQLVRV